MKQVPNNLNALQPLPQNVSANVVNNVNATSTHIPVYNFNDIVSTEIMPATPTPAVAKVELSGSSTLYYWPIFILLTLVFLFFGFRKVHHRKH